MQNFDKYLDSLDEGKIVLKRKYTENYPEKNVRQKANIRNTIIEALRDKKLTLSEFNEIVSQHSKSPSKWTKRNARFFDIKEDNVTLSGYGNKIANTIQPVNEGKKEITKKHWDKADDDQREEWLLGAFSDPDEAEEYIDADWNDLPDGATSNMYESVNEAKSPKNWDSQFTMKAIEAYENGEFDLEDDKSIAEWDKEFNGGRTPKPAFNTKEVVSYAIKTGKKPNGDKMNESTLNERAKTTEMLKHVVKGLTTSVEGIKLSKEMAQAYLDWLSQSTYGKRYVGLPFVNNIFKASFNWGLDKYTNTKNLKDEYKKLKKQAAAMNEAKFVSHYAPGDKFEGKEIKSIKLIDKKKEMYTITFVDGETQNVQAGRGMKFSEKGMFESAKKEMVHTKFTDFVNESYLVEGRWTKDKLIKAFGNSHDGYIVVKGKKYIVYNPNGNNPDNDAMWTDKTVTALIPNDGDDREFKYSEIDDFTLDESIEINEKLKSSKLRGLLSMEKSPKSLLKGIYGQTKIALDQVEDYQIVDVDPKDGPKQDGYVFYYTTQQKENPYSSGTWNNNFPANCLLALARGKKVYYVQARWSRNGAHEYSLTTRPDGGRHSSSTTIGPNKSYSGWDASGLGSLARVIAISDAAFVVNPEALETTGELLMQRSQAKEGAIAFKDDKEFKNANMARYKEILTKRSSTLEVDKEVVKAIEEIADIMKKGIKDKKKDKYNQIIMGTGKNGRTFRINDLTNFTNNLMADYERWAQYTNDAENAKARLEKEGSDRKEEQWEVKYNEREALKHAKDIKDRLKKLKSKNLAW